MSSRAKSEVEPQKLENFAGPALRSAKETMRYFIGGLPGRASRRAGVHLDQFSTATVVSIGVISDPSQLTNETPSTRSSHISC